MGDDGVLRGDARAFHQPGTVASLFEQTVARNATLEIKGFVYFCCACVSSTFSPVK